VVQDLQVLIIVGGKLVMEVVASHLASWELNTTGLLVVAVVGILSVLKEVMVVQAEVEEVLLILVVAVVELEG